MQLNQAIRLISHPSVNTVSKTVWADLGCGDGIFSYALANIISPGSMIHAVDKNKISPPPLPANEKIRINPVQLDFIKDELPFSSLDGILMANSLHYVKDKISLLEKLKKYLNPHHQFIIVEYDTIHANQWVPFPINFTQVEKLFFQAGYNSVIKVNETPSVYRRDNIYSALIAN